jgi:hypothetical protein
MTDMSPRAAATRPEWLPHSFDEDGSRVAFLNVPREEHYRLTFLNDQFFQNRYPVALHDRQAIEASVGEAEQAPLRFIFHTAFCCSTLLVNALDMPGQVTGLKEPGILNDLALRLTRGTPSPHSALLELTTKLLARPFDPDGKVVVKASNVANRLIVPILETRPEARVILVYSDLQTLLLAVARHGLGRRIWARQLYQGLASWAPLPVSTGEASDHADLQIAALAWLMQIHVFDAVAKRFGRDRVMLLDSAYFLAEPGKTLAEASAFLGLGLDQDTLDAVVAGPVFRTHSKAIGADYGVEQRSRDEAAALQAHGREVGEAGAWLSAIASRANIPLTPSFGA